jgi:hypothetical protein
MKKPKHPKHMKDEELMRHLFHPKAVEHIKKLAGNDKKKSTRRV